MKRSEVVDNLRGRKSIMDVQRLQERRNLIGRLLDILTAKLVRIGGGSMMPNYPSGSWVVVNRRAYTWPRKPQRFDVVRFEDPAQRGRWLIKRIVGLPDEEVALVDGQLHINGSPVAEPHIERPMACGSGKHEWWPCTNEYVLLGDNRAASTDSRKFGTVPIGSFRGRVAKRLR